MICLFFKSDIFYESFTLIALTSFIGCSTMVQKYSADILTISFHERNTLSIRKYTLL